MEPLFQPGWQYRIVLYIIFGIVSEFLFTATADLIHPQFVKSWNVHGKESVTTPPSWRITGRDPRGLGYSFLWMLPIYALLIFIEPLKESLKDIPFLLRGILYVLILWGVEYCTGFLIKKITGRCPWDYSASKTNIHGYIRLDFFPLWYAFVLIAEWMSTKFVELTPAIEKIFL